MEIVNSNPSHMCTENLPLPASTHVRILLARTSGKLVSFYDRHLSFELNLPRFNQSFGIMVTGTKL